MAVREPDLRLQGREKVAALRRQAREALDRSARYSGVTLGPLAKDDRGAPLPSNGVYWSLTHKEAFVAAVTAPDSIGVDIERIKAVQPALYRRLADEKEWALASQVTQELFFRYWTAKEAVLKAVGQGFVGLSHCRIRAVVDEHRLTVTYKDSEWAVAHYFGARDHIVAVTAGHVKIQWHLIDPSQITIPKLTEG